MKVVIIGAGMAGLAAATRLKILGTTCACLTRAAVPAALRRASLQIAWRRPPSPFPIQPVKNRFLNYA